MSDLTPEEMEFFKSGDLDALKLPEEEAARLAAPEEPDPEPKLAEAAPVVAEPVAPDPFAEVSRRMEADRIARERLEATIQGLQQKIDEAIKPVSEAPPDPTKDPLGHMMYELAEVRKAVTAMQEDRTTTSKASAEQQRMSEFVNQLTGLRDDFTKTQPDFQDAYKHLREQRSQDLRDVGVPEKDIQQALLQDELAVSQNAITQGKNPAAVLYKMAQRYGYKTSAKPITPSEKLAAIKAGQEADPAPSKGDKTQELTVGGLKDATDSDLNTLVKSDKQWAKIVGGRSDDIFG